MLFQVYVKIAKITFIVVDPKYPLKYREKKIKPMS